MPAIIVSITSTSITLAAGESVQVTAILRNSGQSVDQFTINVEGLDSRWYALPVSSVALFPNDEDSVRIDLHPPGTGVEGGVYPFKLRVVSQEHPAASTTVDLLLRLETLPEIGLEMVRVSSGRKSHYRIIANNPQTTDASIELKTVTSDKRLKFSLDTKTLRIPPGGSVEAELDVSLDWLSLFFGKKQAEFQVMASKAGRAEVQTQVTRITAARWYEVLSQIRLPWLTKPPVISIFKANTDDNREFKLNWSVKRAITIKLDDETVSKRDEKSVRPTEARTYVLTAINRYGSTSSSLGVQPVTVPKPVSCERIRVSFFPGTLKASAGGAPVQVIVQVQNTGPIVDKFSMYVEGLDETWYSHSASSLALMPQATGQTQVVFQPPRRKPVRSGTYAFAITVKSESVPEDFTTVLGELEILPLLDFKASVHPLRLTKRNKGTFRIELTSTGVSEMKLNMTASDSDEGMRLRFKNNPVFLPAWTTIEVPLLAKAKRGQLIGEPKRYDITLTMVDDKGAEKTARCEFNHKPWIRSVTGAMKTAVGWGIAAVVVIGIIVTVQLGGGWGQLFKSPPAWVDRLSSRFSGPSSPADTTVSPTMPVTTAPLTKDGMPTGVPQVLRINLSGEPRMLDPNRAGTAKERTIILQVFEGLLGFNQDLGLRAVVAREIPSLSNKGISGDGLTYTFNLRDDVTWSDGKKVTARDFEYSIKRLFDPDLACTFASLYFDIQGGETCYSAVDRDPATKAQLRDAIAAKAVSDTVLEIKLVSPKPTFLQLMALWPVYPLREDIIAAQGEGWTEPPNYIGNGPFVMTEWVHQDHITLKASGNYWGTRPKLTEITAKMIEDANDALIAYRNNELDIVVVPAGTEKATMADGVLGPQALRYPELTTFGLQFNTTVPPFDNKKVRQALCTGIDRVSLIAGVIGGVGKPAYSWIPPGMPGYNPDLGKQYEFNPAKAKQLLAEAGYANVSSLPQMRYQYGDTPANALIAEFIQQQLKDNLGINLSLEPMAPKDFNDLVSSKQYTCAWFGWAADYPDPDDWLPEVYATDGTGNRSSYSNPEFDRIANQAMIELNTTRRLQLWSDAHEIVVEDVPIAFMLNRERFVLVKPSIRGSLKNTGMDGAVAGDMCFSEVYKSQ